MTLISLCHFLRRRFSNPWFFLTPLFFLFFLGTVLPLEAQRRLAPRPIPYSELEREEGEQRLAEMRRMGIAGVHSFVFELRVMPRRGAETRYQGQLWGSRNVDGPVYRYEIRSGRGEDARVIRFLVQNGFSPKIWLYDTADDKPAVRRLETEELFIRLKGTDFTPFDLQMPYLFWQDVEYEGLSRVRGRSSHGFLMYPPEEVAEAFEWLAGVRIYLDAEFNALTAVEVIGDGAEVLRSFNIIEIKRVKEEWIVKSIDYHDRRTGDKTRLSIRGASFGLAKEKFQFSPEALEKAFPAIPREDFTLF